jgi:hypothetical protein
MDIVRFEMFFRGVWQHNVVSLKSYFLWILLHVTGYCGFIEYKELEINQMGNHIPRAKHNHAGKGRQGHLTMSIVDEDNSDSLRETMNNEVLLCDTALVYLQTEAEDAMWYPPLAVKWDFTLVKAYDEDFVHCFPKVLAGCIFKHLKRRYFDREFIHVIGKNDSVSYSMNGPSMRYDTKWGEAFPPNNAEPSNVYRQCAEEQSAWIDTRSHILYYKQNEHRGNECTYEGIWNIFAGSNAIPQKVLCSREGFINFAMGIRDNYIKIVCNSATVCLIDNGHIQSTHKVYHPNMLILFTTF